MKNPSKTPVIFIILIVVLIGVIFGLFALSQNFGTLSKSDITAEYDGLTTDDHVFEAINYSKVQKMIDNQETFFLYMGSPLCSHCQDQISSMNMEAQLNGVQTVYYFEINSGISNNVLSYLEDNFGLDGTPTVSYIVNGQLYYTTADHRTEFTTYKDMYDAIFSLGE